MANLTLIIPTKKEAESLPTFLKELENYNFNKLIVLQEEDIETQKAIAKIDDIDILVQKNPGYGNALKEGIEATKTEYSCIINADGSMDPKYLSEMINECKNRDIVFGSRYQKPGGGSDDDDVITFIGNKVFTFITKSILRIKLSDILYTYVLCNVNKFNNLNLRNNDFKLCIELPVKVKKNNHT